MEDHEAFLARCFVGEAADSAADAKGNGEDARHLAAGDRFDKCLFRLEWLKQNSARAALYADLAIEKIKKMKEKQ